MFRQDASWCIPTGGRSPTPHPVDAQKHHRVHEGCNTTSSFHVHRVHVGRCRLNGSFLSLVFMKRAARPDQPRQVARRGKLLAWRSSYELRPLKVQKVSIDCLCDTLREISPAYSGLFLQKSNPYKQRVAFILP